ncbi:Importin-beta N-terminal domain containing protein, partial [Aphelenchoides avenae]
DLSILTDPDVLKNVAHILKTNVAACKSIGSPFFAQLQKIHLDMLNVYKVISSFLSNVITEHGEEVLKTPNAKQMRVVKKEILTLLSTWIARAFDSRSDSTLVTPALVIKEVIQPLLDTVLRDYEMNVAAAREPKVLSLLSITVVSLKEEATPLISPMLDAVFMCTLEMINKDMEAYPEHRTNFFQLLNAINRHCFNHMISLPDETFGLFIQAVVWAFKHSMRNVAELGFEILREILKKVDALSTTDGATAQTFYQKYFMTILEHVLSVVTDHNQVPFVGLTNLAETVCALFHAAEERIVVNLNAANPTQKNMDFIFETIAGVFKAHFSNLTEAQISVTIKGFFSFNRSVPKMREHIRDFLVQIKEEAGEDTADLFLEEKESEIQKTQQEKMAIPGVQNPNAVAEEDGME